MIVSAPKITTITCSVLTSHPIDVFQVLQDIEEKKHSSDSEATHTDEDVSGKTQKFTKKNTQRLHPTHIFIKDTQVFLRLRLEAYRSRSGKKRSNFSNCFAFVVSLPGKGNRSIKYFNNGHMHVTGCKSEEEIHDLCEEFLAKACEFIECNEVPKITGLTMTMVNANCKADKQFNLYELSTKLSSHFSSVSYDPDEYFGIKLQNISPSYRSNIFRTGAILLTGMKHPSELPSVYQHFVESIKIVCA